MADVYDLNNSGLQVSESQNITFNKDIVLTLKTDQGERSIVVCKLYCTIVTNQSIQYYMTVEDKTLYQNNKSDIQKVIDEFKTTAAKLAEVNNVPII
jgi:hypothetical protein